MSLFWMSRLLDDFESGLQVAWESSDYIATAPDSALTTLFHDYHMMGVEATLPVGPGYVGNSSFPFLS